MYSLSAAPDWPAGQLHSASLSSLCFTEFTLLHCASLCFTLLHSASLCFTLLHSALLRFTPLYSTSLCYTPPTRRIRRLSRAFDPARQRAGRRSFIVTLRHSVSFQSIPQTAPPTPKPNPPLRPALLTQRGGGRARAGRSGRG